MIKKKTEIYLVGVVHSFNYAIYCTWIQAFNSKRLTNEDRM